MRGGRDHDDRQGGFYGGRGRGGYGERPAREERRHLDDEDEDAPTELLTKEAEHELGSKAANFMENLENLAAETQVSVVYISDNTEEGSQLLHGFYGMGAILRYPMM